ncbi:MAG: alpha/beta hydrolase [Bacteroidota bacterium]
MNVASRWDFNYSYPYAVDRYPIEPGDYNIAYRWVGDAKLPVALLIHGLGSYMRAWDPVLPILTAHFHCLVVDLPFYGLSHGQYRPMGMSDFGEALFQLLDGLEVRDPVTLIGHSMGGQIGLQMALETTHRISRLFLVAPAGLETFSKAESDRIIEFYQPEVLAKISQAGVLQNFHRCFYSFPDSAQFMVDDRLKLRAENSQFLLFLEQYCNCLKAMLEAPIYEDLPTIKQPVGIFFGLDDQFIPSPLLHPDWDLRSYVSKTAEKLKKPFLYFTDFAGHFPHWDRPDSFQKGLLAFLSEA